VRTEDRKAGGRGLRVIGFEESETAGAVDSLYPRVTVTPSGTATFSRMASTRRSAP
jgi:hypothetical protein